MSVHRRIISWLLMLGIIGLGWPAVAQPPVPGAFETFWNNATVPGTPATNNWTNSGNWTTGIPDVISQDYGTINNGGVAYVNSVVSQQAGGVSLGTNAGQSGTLDILSGGRLTVVDDTPGGGGLPSDGAVRIGQGGTGSLFVRPGGRLDSTAILLGAASANSQLTLGGTTPGTTTVNTGTVTLGRNTRITGPNVNFNATGPITFQATSVYTAEITGPIHSTLVTSGAATLDGTLQLDFTGHTPVTGNAWNLVNAASISGSFNVVNDPSVTLGLGQVMATRTVAGGNGQIHQLFVDQLPMLIVNRTTGDVSIMNPATSGNVVIDGYSISSSNGAINVANWDSFQENPAVAGAGWFESDPFPDRVAEIRDDGESSLGPMQSWPLGNIFQNVPATEFGDDANILFEYTNSYTTSGVGLVQFVGSTGVNNLVLFADPGTGNVKIRNTSPFTIAIDGYRITSPNGSLRHLEGQWMSLQDQGAEGGTWFEIDDLSANQVGEIQMDGVTTLVMHGGTTLDLGMLFNTSGVRDLQFEFLRADGTPESDPRFGLVLYEAAPAGLPGDYNGDGRVDAGDYVRWRNNLGDPTEADINNNGDGGGVTLTDYTFWKQRYGNPGGGDGGGSFGGATVPAPEPSAWMLSCLTAGVLLVVRPRGAAALEWSSANRK